MSEQRSPRGTARDNDRSVVKQTDEWSIELSTREACVYVRSLDHHAGPLRLTGEDIRRLGRLTKRKNRDRKKYAK
jgi:hypothetical protein